MNKKISTKKSINNVIFTRIIDASIKKIVDICTNKSQKIIKKKIYQLIMMMNRMQKKKIK